MMVCVVGASGKLGQQPGRQESGALVAGPYRADTPRRWPTAIGVCWSLSADQATRARSLTIRRLLVLASSRSIAAVRSLGGASVDQRLPTRRISPRSSRSWSRASVFSLLSPAAREAIAVENELGSFLSAARRRSGRRVVSRSFAGGSAAARSVSADAGLRPTGGSSPNRARQLAHKTTGSRPAGRTISNSRHLRPERHTPQPSGAFYLFELVGIHRNPRSTIERRTA